MSEISSVEGLRLSVTEDGHVTISIDLPEELRGKEKLKHILIVLDPSSAASFGASMIDVSRQLLALERHEDDPPFLIEPDSDQLN